MSRPAETLSLVEARRIALAAQGFGPRHPRQAGAPRIGGLIRKLGLVQIDYVNVLVPAHYLVPFSRLGPYRRGLLDQLASAGGGFTEHWAHEASILPVEHWPLFRHRMETHRVRPWGFEKFIEQNPAYVDHVLAEIRARGPLTAEDLHVPEGVSRRIPGTWGRTVPRAVMEAFLGRGVLGVAGRRPNMARVYDLAERLVPRVHLDQRVDPEAAHRELLRLAARASGLGTVQDLADYYRLSPRAASPRIRELVDEGELYEVRVEGWKDVAYLHRDVAAPSPIEASALLAPFDPVVWHRPRAARLFGFEYRVEIYVPEEKRQWGYYVLPFLMGDRLVARVDLKADRREGQLLVPAAYLEPGIKPGPVAEALSRELGTLAGWLGLGRVVVGRRGGLSRALRALQRD